MKPPAGTSLRRCLLLAVALQVGAATAGEARVAVAANFAGPVKQLAARFSRQSEERLTVVAGSTGKLYAQIANGAPFDVFLSADDETPRRMEREKIAVAGSRFTYALGKLVLWSPAAGAVDDKGAVLRDAPFRRIAIANPKLAPYGAAARQAMQKLGVWTALQSRLVLGENVAQTLQFVSSRNADLGFVAYAQLLGEGGPPAGSYWLVTASLYDPIRQDAVLLARGRDNPVAAAFLAFLQSPAARSLIVASGYGLP